MLDYWEAIRIFLAVLCYVQLFISHKNTFMLKEFLVFVLHLPCVPDVCFNILGARCSSVVRAFAHGAMGRRIDPSVNPLSYFLFQPVLYDWCNKGHGMCYPVCGMVHIKEPLLLIGKSSQCGGSGFPLSLSEWSFNICLMPYNHK